jgi:putative hydrolase of the HAD superfamily
LASRIKALSFDLWDTLILDDSDEPERKAKGLRSKKAERRYVTWEALNRVEPIPLERVSLAYDVVDAAFNEVWHRQEVTWTIERRIAVLLGGLGRTLPDTDLQKLIRSHETMEVEIPPDPIPGVDSALAELHRRYRLCVLSDVIVTPGRNLKKLLEHHGLARHFDAFTFSDEVGRSKPHRDMFAAAARALGVDFQEMVHVGDRQHNDIAGAQALGLKAVLFTGSRDADRSGTTADAVCERYADLSRLVEKLAG